MQMKDYQKNFIEFLLSMQALKFGNFTLKSGRKSPYFLNMGAFFTGKAITRIGSFYADAIADAIKDDFNVIFGPAYKGIPLAISTLQSLYTSYGIDAQYAFNRKEAKDHGEAGIIVGKALEPSDRIIIVDDVITAGTAIRETLDIIKNQGGASVRAIVVSVDRMEKGSGNKSAAREITEAHGIAVCPIITILHILEYVKTGKAVQYGVDSAMIAKIEAYLAEYGSM